MFCFLKHNFSNYTILITSTLRCNVILKRVLFSCNASNDWKITHTVDLVIYKYMYKKNQRDAAWWYVYL